MKKKINVAFKIVFNKWRTIKIIRKYVNNILYCGPFKKKEQIYNFDINFEI